jgi:PadR family transcriptional regulator PadR
MKTKKARDLDLGLIRLYILHRAAMEPILARGITADLHRHGFSLSPGSAARILRVLEEKGYLACRQSEKSYTTTASGRLAIDLAAVNLRTLFARGAGISLQAGR